MALSIVFRGLCAFVGWPKGDADAEAPGLTAVLTPATDLRPHDATLTLPNAAVKFADAHGDFSFVDDELREMLGWRLDNCRIEWINGSMGPIRCTHARHLPDVLTLVDSGKPLPPDRMDAPTMTLPAGTMAAEGEDPPVTWGFTSWNQGDLDREYQAAMGVVFTPAQQEHAELRLSYLDRPAVNLIVAPEIIGPQGRRMDVRIRIANLTRVAECGRPPGANMLMEDFISHYDLLESPPAMGDRYVPIMRVATRPNSAVCVEECCRISTA
jgi:hypothetical protein